MSERETFNHFLNQEPFNYAQIKLFVFNCKWALVCLKNLPTKNLFKNHMYKQDLALNNPQGLICHKSNQPTIHSFVHS